MILKMHTNDGDAVFTDIGKEYTVVKRDFPRFSKLLENQYGPAPEDRPEKLYAFITYNGGISVYPLFEGFSYYVYTEGGRLFDTLTFR